MKRVHRVYCVLYRFVRYTSVHWVRVHNVCKGMRCMVMVYETYGNVDVIKSGMITLRVYNIV